jgi:senataxin
MKRHLGKVKSKAEDLAGTIDSWQGGESEVIIISTVCSGLNSELKFISDNNRINVALTRAKHLLIVIGNL